MSSLARSACSTRGCSSRVRRHCAFGVCGIDGGRAGAAGLSVRTRLLHVLWRGLERVLAQPDAIAGDAQLFRRRQAEQEALQIILIARRMTDAVLAASLWRPLDAGV